MKKSLFTTIIILSFAIFNFGQQRPIHNLDPYNPEFAKGEILVKFKDQVQIDSRKSNGQIKSGQSSIDTLLSKWNVKEMEKVFKNEKYRTLKKSIKTFDGKTIDVPQLYNIYKLETKEGTDIKKMVEEFSKNPNIDFAEPNYLVYTMETYPDDPLYQGGEQWYIDAVNAPAAWDSTTSDTSQIIGIIDTGVDWDHPDLDNNIWRNWDEIPDNGIDDDGNGFVDDIRGWDFINNDNDPNDDNSHGTHVAGITAAESNNSIGIAGIAWNAKVMPIKMLQSSGQGSSSDLAQAINYAAHNGSTVINMSLGSYGESLTVKTALENAYAYAVLVAAAGNNGYKIDPPYPPWPIYAPLYPACYSFVIGVEATDQTNELTGFSNFDPSGPVVAGNNFGHNYEIKAPGVGIYSTVPNGNYRFLNGTSMASPIVSGAVALMKSYNPAQSTEQLFSRLIQGTNNGILDIRNSLDYELEPDLYFVEFTMVDILPGCDNDGIVDAGETIEIYLTVKNAGGFADSVWTKLRFREFEDTTTSDIIDSTSFIGDISAYATMTGELDPFRIEIDPDVANNRDIVFEYEIGYKNTDYNIKNNFVISITNGEEISGLLEHDTTFAPDKFWMINSSLRIGTGVTLTILPGTHVQINAGVDNRGFIHAVGTPDSLIMIEGTFGGNSLIKYVNLDLKGNSFYYNGNRLENCIITNGASFSAHIMDRCFISEFNNFGHGGGIRGDSIRNCYFKDIDTYNFGGNIYTSVFDNLINLHYPGNVISSSKYSVYNGLNGKMLSWQLIGYLFFVSSDMGYYKNTFLTNSINAYFVRTDGGSDVVNFPNQYWGTSDNLKIRSKYFDFWNNAGLPLLNYQPILTAPSDSCPGHVWKVLVNGKDAQDEYVDPLGVGPQRFDVYFNRPMDTAYTPQLTFGVREPFIQHVVHDNASWSSDSTIWTAYYDVGLETGDGINRIMVSRARDPESWEIPGWEIPVEDSRFQFVIQAAGSQSINFIATAGIGKVNLEWPGAETNDILGYNMYRYENITDSTFSDTTLINTELITDSTYTDFDVIPDTTYHYLYKIVGTDMQESDFSKSVLATPFLAANGDANGDLAVNVLDIITIVDYMLLNNPTPFLFDAADLNGDNAINVLDIISVINIILSKKSDVTSENAQQAVFSIKNNQIWISCDGTVAGYQFKLKGNVNNISLASYYPMEVCTKQIVENEILVIVYSLNKKLIPKGDHPILSITGGKEYERLSGYNVIASDPIGNLINAHFKNTITYVPENNLEHEGYSLEQNYPNPFDQTTRISYNVPEKTDVNIKIFNSLSQIVYQYNRKSVLGKHTIIWLGEDNKGNKLPPGIYFYQLKTKDYVKAKQMIYMK